MERHDLDALRAGLPLLDLSQGPTREEAFAAARTLGTLGGRELGLARFRGQPPWERHARDELLLVLDGAVELTLLEGAEPTRVELRAGARAVVPAGVWHRSNAPEEVTVVFGTPSDGNESSLAADPRGAGDA